MRSRPPKRRPALRRCCGCFPSCAHEQLVELLATLITQQPGVLLTVAQRVADLHAGGTLAWGRTVVAAAAETLHEPDSRFADALTNCLDRAEAAGPAVSGPLARLVLDTVGGVYDVAPKGMRNHELPLVISQAVRLHQEACAVGAVDAAELASFLIGWSFTNTGMLDAIEVAVLVTTLLRPLTSLMMRLCTSPATAADEEAERLALQVGEHTRTQRVHHLLAERG